MNTVLPLSNDKKLSVTYRVEPGCLGPDGMDYVKGFCQFAQQKAGSIDLAYALFEFVPRYDKSLPELQYQVVGKAISSLQATKFLAVFGSTLDEFEMN